MKISMWTATSVIFLIWAVVASGLAAQYYQTTQNQQTTISNLQSVVNNVAIKANIGINYGNGTIQWYNGTYVPIGDNLFNATERVATFNTTTYPGMGTFVTGINGVMQNTTASKYWVYDSWNGTAWTIIWVAPAEYILHSDEIVMWSLKQF